MESEFTSVGTCRGFVFASVPCLVMWAGIVGLVIHFC